MAQGPGDGLIGMFEGGFQSASGVWRPTVDSIMRHTGQPFYAVNQEAWNYSVLLNYPLTSYNLTSHSVEERGEEYDNYVVEFYVDNYSEQGVFNFKSFATQAEVHILTSNIN